MLIILTVYLVLVWLVFSRLKLIRWGWVSGSLAVLIGAFILAVFMAMFILADNFLYQSKKNGRNRISSEFGCLEPVT